MRTFIFLRPDVPNIAEWIQSHLTPETNADWSFLESGEIEIHTDGGDFLYDGAVEEQ